MLTCEERQPWMERAEAEVRYAIEKVNRDLAATGYKIHVSGHLGFSFTPLPPEEVDSSFLAMCGIAPASAIGSEALPVIARGEGQL